MSTVQLCQILHIDTLDQMSHVLYIDRPFRPNYVRRSVITSHAHWSSGSANFRALTCFQVLSIDGPTLLNCVHIPFFPNHIYIGRPDFAKFCTRRIIITRVLYIDSPTLPRSFHWLTNSEILCIDLPSLPRSVKTLTVRVFLH